MNNTIPFDYRKGTSRKGAIFVLNEVACMFMSQ